MDDAYAEAVESIFEPDKDIISDFMKISNDKLWNLGSWL